MHTGTHNYISILFCTNESENYNLMFFEKNLYVLPGNEIILCILLLPNSTRNIEYNFLLILGVALQHVYIEKHALKKRMYDVRSEIIPQHFVIFVIDFSVSG